MKRALLTVVAVLTALVGWLSAAPPQLGGTTAYVTTHGVSMQPLFHTGDLAVLRPAGHYRIGEIAGYRSQLLHTVVLHRIIGIHRGRYTFKGDHNSWVDPEHPTHGQIIGALALRVPHGGLWLHAATSPPALALIVFLLLTAGGATTLTRRQRKRERMRHAARRRTAPGLRLVPPSLQPFAAVVVAAAVLGLTLAILAWTGPATTSQRRHTQRPATVTFSYTATVPRTAAYDGTTVHSPDPVFRKLTHLVDLHYHYRGDPGTISLTARASTGSGWHTSIPLSPPTRFTGHSYTGTALLNLNRVDARTQAAARATGVAATQTDVAVTATVRTSYGTASPALHMTLAPLTFAPTNGPDRMTVTVPIPVTDQTTVPRTLHALGQQLAVRTARLLASALLLAAFAAGLVLLLLLRRHRRQTETTRIRRDHPALLVPVEPTALPSTKPVVDVTDFAALARISDRHSLFVLHWTRSDVTTYLVHDDAVTFRYRASNQQAAGVTKPSEPADAISR